jgi:hypothetical protein
VKLNLSLRLTGACFIFFVFEKLNYKIYTSQMDRLLQMNVCFPAKYYIPFNFFPSKWGPRPPSNMLSSKFKCDDFYDNDNDNDNDSDSDSNNDSDCDNDSDNADNNNVDSDDDKKNSDNYWENDIINDNLDDAVDDIDNNDRVWETFIVVDNADNDNINNADDNNTDTDDDNDDKMERTLKEMLDPLLKKNWQRSPIGQYLGMPFATFTSEKWTIITVSALCWTLDEDELVTDELTLAPKDPIYKTLEKRLSKNHQSDWVQHIDSVTGGGNIEDIGDAVFIFLEDSLIGLFTSIGGHPYFSLTINGKSLSYCSSDGSGGGLEIDDPIQALNSIIHDNY